MQSSLYSPILIIRAQGYAVSHIIKLLLKQDYKVRGTVSCLANQDKYKLLYELVWSKKDNLALVEADLLCADSRLMAVDGCKYAIHDASPIPLYVPKDENEIIRPAVEGTINVMNVALAKRYKKVVVTSIPLAFIFENEGKTLTEHDWSDPSKTCHYPKSKVLTEKTAWEFYAKNKDKSK